MRHRFHSLCPYFAMFPEAFAETWIERLTEPGDLVLDPFCGRGTAPFQALLMGRSALGSDINPVAYCVTRAKTNAPAPSALKSRLTKLERGFRRDDWNSLCRAMPAFFQCAYAPDTLEQLLYLRSSLRWQSSDVDCMLAALILGTLHGETKKSPSYLSNQMPRTISTKPAYSIRFWEKHGLVAPQRDAFALLRAQIAYRYLSAPPPNKAKILQTDFRDLPRMLRDGKALIRLVITSPPYLDVTNFEEDQWLRLWFLGGLPRPTYRKISKDDRHENPGTYWRLIADMWRVLGTVLRSGADVVIRLGGRKLTPAQIVAGLEAASLFSKRRVELVGWDVSALRNRQTASFRPGAQGCAQEVDCHFRIA